MAIVKSVGVFGGPLGSYGFRRGKWLAALEDGTKFEFFASISHSLDLWMQEKMLIENAQAKLDKEVG